MESKNISQTPISDQELSMQKAFERALVNVWLPSKLKAGTIYSNIDNALTAINNQTGDKIEDLWMDVPPPPTPPRVFSTDHPTLKAKRSLDLARALQVFSILLQLATVALLALALGRL